MCGIIRLARLCGLELPALIEFDFIFQQPSIKGAACDATMDATDAIAVTVFVFGILAFGDVVMPIQACGMLLSFVGVQM